MGFVLYIVGAMALAYYIHPTVDALVFPVAWRREAGLFTFSPRSSAPSSGC